MAGTFCDKLGRVHGIVNNGDTITRLYDQDGHYGLLTTEAHIRLFEYQPGTYHPMATYTVINEEKVLQEKLPRVRLIIDLSLAASPMVKFSAVVITAYESTKPNAVPKDAGVDYVYSVATWQPGNLATWQPGNLASGVLAGRSRVPFSIDPWGKRRDSNWVPWRSVT
ncbi:hypothetical protein [Microbulbifer sp. ZKSA002]|uniref:hypothetical protein n=1 Tax=Microbulbifer sp. ZKSA002 TaxID=3243388 RepID=UPI0040390998